MENTSAENIVQRIVEVCKQKKIPVSKLEKDLGYGNGYLNPKKVSDMKASRLMEILEYLEISWEEFFDTGSKKFQKTETALLKLRKENPEFYDYLINQTPVTTSDGVLPENILDLSTLSLDQQLAIKAVVSSSSSTLSQVRPAIELLLSPQQVQDDQG